MIPSYEGFLSPQLRIRYFNCFYCGHIILAISSQTIRHEILGSCLLNCARATLIVAAPQSTLFQLSNKLLNVCPSVPSRAPSYIRLSNLQFAEVKVQWEPLLQQYANGRLLGYKVYFREYTSYYYYYSYFTKTVNTSSANVTMVILRDLRQATRYEIAVAAFTSKGEGPRSYWTSVTTGNPFVCSRY